jgi:hypothetical protein
MNIEEQLQILSRQTCPKQVDVVDAVMAQVRQKPYLQPAHRTTLWRTVALTAVAAVAALVVLNIGAFRSYDEEGIGSMIASVSDYDYYSTVESAATNPIEYLYEDAILEPIE